MTADKRKRLEEGMKRLSIWIGVVGAIVSMVMVLGATLDDPGAPLVGTFLFTLVTGAVAFGVVWALMRSVVWLLLFSILWVIDGFQ